MAGALLGVDSDPEGAPIWSGSECQSIGVPWLGSRPGASRPGVKRPRVDAGDGSDSDWGTASGSGDLRNVVDEDDILKSAANAESLSSSFPISDLGHRLGAILHDFFGYYPTQRSFVACGNSCAPGPGIPN